jgi:hypothetical protein
MTPRERCAKDAMTFSALHLIPNPPAIFWLDHGNKVSFAKTLGFRRFYLLLTALFLPQEPPCDPKEKLKDEPVLRQTFNYPKWTFSVEQSVWFRR